MIVWGFVELVVPLSSLGLLQAMQRYLPELASRGDHKNLRAFIRFVSIARFLVLFVFCGLLAVFWEPLSKWMGFNSNQQSESVVAVLLVITVLGQRFVAEMLESMLEQGYAQTVRALEPLGRLVGVGALIAVGHVRLGDVFLVDLIVTAACLVLAEVFLVRQVSSIRPAGDYRVSAGEVARYAWHMLGWQWLNAAGGVGVLRMIVARMLGLEVAGQFAFLQQLTLVASRYLPGTMLANVIRPMLISRHAGGQAAEVAHGFGLLLKGNFLLIAGGVVLLAAAGDSLMALASGDRVQDGGLVMLLMVLSLMGAAQGQVVAMAMQIYHYTSQLRNFSVLALAMPFLVWVGSTWGLVGVAMAMIFELWFRNGLILAWLQRQPLRIGLDWPGYMRGLLVAVPLVLLGFVIDGMALDWPAAPWVAFVTVGVLYMAGLRLVRPLGAGEFDLVRKAVGGLARWVAPWSRAH